MTTTTTTPTLGSVLRWTKDIGMFAIDRSREESCVHRSEFCNQTCFNIKLERAFAHTIGPKDAKNDIAWSQNDTVSLVKTLKAKRRQTSRARLMTRGEAFKDLADIARVEAILTATPDVAWWVPTRAWRSPIIWLAIQGLISRNANIKVLASVDPSDDADMVQAIEDSGASTMFYGDDSALKSANGSRRFKCPKTHAHLNGHCAICKAGCFADKQVHVHLAQH